MRLSPRLAPLILALFAVPALGFAPLGAGSCWIRNRAAPGFVCRLLSAKPRPLATRNVALESLSFPRSVRPSTLTAVNMAAAYTEERYKIAGDFEIAARVWFSPSHQPPESVVSG